MAASSYDEALRRLLAHEGGYSDHPSDPGGPTKYGITIATFRRWVNPAASTADLKAMSMSQAKGLYRAHYWDALGCDRLPAGLDYAVFDYGVNSGTARAATVVRRIAGIEGAGAPLDTATLSALGRGEAAGLIGRLCDERLAFLKNLKTWPVFGRGWARRVSEVREAALAMAAAARVAPAAQVGAAVPGKGIVPLERAAQRGSAGTVAAGGAIAAAAAHRAGAPPVIVLGIVIAAAALAVAAWMAWRGRQERRQTAA
jgi:lysozyme family protein